jgi:hypothetical protein
VSDAALTVTLDDLAWWSATLSTARAAGELPPGTFRFRALAQAARDEVAAAEAVEGAR